MIGREEEIKYLRSLKSEEAAIDAEVGDDEDDDI